MENLFSEMFAGREFTKTQSMIANYFLDNQYSIANSSLADISKAVGVSDISVLRFVRTLGFSNYTDFKKHLREKIMTQLSLPSSNYTLSDRFESNFIQGENTDLRLSYSTMLHKNLENTLLQNSAEAYEKVVKMISSARHKYVLGIRSCRGISLCFSRLLKYMVNDVIDLSTIDNDVFFQMFNMQSDDLTIIFCASRYYKRDLQIINNIKKEGCKICLITDSILSPLAKEADIVLVAYCTSFSFFNSMVGFDAIAEYLLTLLGLQNEIFIRDRLNNLDSIVKDSLL